MQKCLYLCSRKGVAMNAIVLAIIVLAVAMVLLSVGVIFRKDHQFRSQHINQNERMKADKIHCAMSMDKEQVRKQERKIDIKKL